MGFHIVPQRPKLNEAPPSVWFLVIVSGEEKAGWCVLSLLCFGLEGTHATSALSPLAEHEDLPNYKGQGNVERRTSECWWAFVSVTVYPSGHETFLCSLYSTPLFTPCLGEITPNPSLSRHFFPKWYMVISTSDPVNNPIWEIEKFSHGLFVIWKSVGQGYLGGTVS